MKKGILLIVVIAMMLMLVACDDGSTVNPDGSITENFGYYLDSAEDISFYADYSKNPYVEYIETMKWNTDDEGRDVYIDFDFQSPATGQELNQIVTMLSTGSYLDIMSIQQYKRAGSVKDLYEQGIALDLTDYVENYMPNYMAFLEAHPDLLQTATSFVDGERRFIELYNYNDLAESFWGFQYRRDWIVEYADEVHGGTPFSRWEDEEGYHDDVVFPNGTGDPIYISDWEWMFEIFDYALNAEGIDDGYVTTIPYSGYAGTGDLMLNSSGTYFKDGDTIKYGPTTENFRAYIQMANTWYENGWVDERFVERTSDMFYQINVTGFMNGKVGLWYSGVYALEDQLETGLPNSDENGYTEDIYVYAARQPINDMYGPETIQDEEPFVFYQPSLEFSSIIITDKAEDKDLVALVKLLDYGFSEEGAFTKSFGLTAEQYQLTNNELMTREGFQNGLYEMTDVDGEEKVEFLDRLKQNEKLRLALIGTRFFGLTNNTDRYFGYSNNRAHNMEQIDYYRAVGYLRDSFVGQLDVDDLENYSKTISNITGFLERNIPAFIIGDKDPFSDTEWNALINAINKYGPHVVTEDLQDLLDSFN